MEKKSFAKRKCCHRDSKNGWGSIKASRKIISYCFVVVCCFFFGFWGLWVGGCCLFGWGCGLKTLKLLFQILRAHRRNNNLINEHPQQKGGGNEKEGKFAFLKNTLSLNEGARGSARCEKKEGAPKGCPDLKGWTKPTEKVGGETGLGGAHSAATREKMARNEAKT